MYGVCVWGGLHLHLIDGVALPQRTELLEAFLQPFVEGAVGGAAADADGAGDGAVIVGGAGAVRVWRCVVELEPICTAAIWIPRWRPNLHTIRPVPFKEGVLYDGHLLL